MAHSTSTAALLVRVVVAFALTYVLGYERELRGSPGGDRTFSLIGTASAVLGNLAGVGSPNAIAGAVTGIGFIGGGIVVRRAVRTGEIISGITTAASIFATAAIGAAAGPGSWRWPRWRLAWFSSPWKDPPSVAPAGGRPPLVAALP